MKKQIVIGVVALIALITPMIIYYQNDIETTHRLADQLKKEYPSFEVRDNTTGMVSGISHPYPEEFKDHPHQAFVFLNDSIKRRIRTGYELNTGLTLDSILNVGDRVFKKSGSDTLFVCKTRGRDSTIYCFQLHDDLGYPLKQR